MRSKQRLLTVGGTLLVAALLATAACAHAAAIGSQPETRRVVHNEREIEVDTAIADPRPILDELVRRGMSVGALWHVPGAPDISLAVVERPPTGTAYGPQLVALRAGGMRVLHESPRLYDDDFVAPTFFTFAHRTLVLADHGSEDAYGVLVWSIENGTVRDLGRLDIALPEEQDVFTRGAASTARVAMTDGTYVITIPGPVLLNARGEDERLLAKRGELVTFRENRGRLELVQP